MSNISVGGQAVIEGVMMQSKDKRAIAVRKSNGKIVLKKNNIKSWINETNINKIPFLRGSFILLETMIEGIKSLNFSSEFFIEDGEEDAFDRFIKKIFKDKANDAIIGISLVLSLLFSVGIFILIPTTVGGIFSKIIDNKLIPLSRINSVLGRIPIARITASALMGRRLVRTFSTDSVPSTPSSFVLVKLMIPCSAR